MRRRRSSRRMGRGRRVFSARRRGGPRRIGYRM
ncbi:MAG: hypothetical protein [Arizlama microvirus]|nr:MAG: hypothetical protein [Arizlama microvirus]